MDDRRDRIESIEAELVGGARFQAEEVCVRLGINRDILDVCIRWQVVEPDESSAFTESAMERVRRALRLHYDLGVNWAGVAVMLDLLDRIEVLEREIALLKEDA